MIFNGCLVTDRYNITQDLKMTFLSDVLSPAKVIKVFLQHLSLFVANLDLVAIEVIRYKPQKRCLIEYTFEGKSKLVLIGKIRAKGTDTKSYNLQKQLWASEFSSDSDDGISVPEPVGIIPQWQMWVQKKVPGNLIINHLIGREGINISKRIAQIAHKLHNVDIITQRRHTITEELAILEQKLPLVINDYPPWRSRIATLLEQCFILGENTPEVELVNIHRDFYFDQILVDGDRFYLLDFDLYCRGNPNLDLGNFLGHIQEYSLRVLGDVNKLKEQENTLIKEYIKLTQPENLAAIQAYTTLTLVRHIYLSNQFPQRRFCTEELLNLCEKRLNFIKV
ncbi:aminoglycoside phosphotransferase [Chondrocystis sp. NIES-4102]|nr:aminoglycoside phosphotransferase [Chondrocystis sp. NIES-4102]